MRNIFWILVAAITLIGCGRSREYYGRMLNDAERLADARMPDSALTLLDRVDVADLKHDSLRMQYHYIMGLAHLKQNRSFIADSLIGTVYGYYRGKDIRKEMLSGTMTAWYKFWVGDTRGAMVMLDSLIGRTDVPDSLTVLPLRVRTMLGVAQYDGAGTKDLAKRLMAIETDSLRRMEAKYLLCECYEYSEHLDSALVLIDGLIAYARCHHWGDKQFEFEYERSQILTELGLYAESDAAIDEIFRKAPQNGAAHFLHLQRAINRFNNGLIDLAKVELECADSIAASANTDDNAYYQSFSRLLRTMMDYRTKDRLTLQHIAQISNRQQERFNRMKASQWESERGALQQQSRALALKAESQHKTVVILAVTLLMFIVIMVSLWILWNRRRRELEHEERIETLQKMVDDLKTVPNSAANTSEVLRRAMLQQLGIVKMVAETPTEQNREMLRRISSIGAEIGNGLVNWDNLYEVIDNLYGGFHSKLHAAHGSDLTEKEEQIIVLMVAGFSTKEIAVITSQSTATIYVRKSSVRRKLGIPEKEDIVAFLHG